MPKLFINIEEILSRTHDNFEVQNKVLERVPKLFINIEEILSRTHGNFEVQNKVLERVPKLFINIEEILSRTHGNFEAQNKVLEPSIIIINYCISINAHYNCIINVWCNSYIMILRKASSRNAIRKTIWQ